MRFGQDTIPGGSVYTSHPVLDGIRLAAIRMVKLLLAVKRPAPVGGPTGNLPERSSKESSMAQPPLVPAKTAVLSMDLQTAIVSIYAKDRAKDRPELIERAAGILNAARGLGMKVIHVRVGFRPGLPEVSSRNLLFGSIKNSPQHQAIFEGAAGEIHPGLAPQADDITVVKHRVSAFAGTDLEMILRAKGIDHLILMGIATSGVVLSTTRHAADADYRITIVRDCCADRDEEVHRVLLDKVFVRQAAIVTAADVLGALPN